MGMHMPRINYYLCSASGVLHVAPPATPDPFVGKGYPLLSDKLAGAGSDDEKLPEDVWACANQMGASNHVDGMVRAYSPAAWIHLHVDGRPVKVARPGQLGAWNLSVPATKDGLRPVVVGLSLKGTYGLAWSRKGVSMLCLDLTHEHAHTLTHSQDGG